MADGKPAEASRAGIVSTFSHLLDHERRWVKRTLAGYAAGELAYSWYKARAQRRLEASQYIVSVQNDDNIYNDLHHWLVDHMPPSDRRALTARTSVENRSSSSPVELCEKADDDVTIRKKAEVHLFYDGSIAQRVDVGGHQVLVSVYRPEKAGGVSSMDMIMFVRKLDEVIQFKCDSEAARDAVIDMLTELASKQTVRLPSLYAYNRWGGWDKLSDAPIRHLESVVLADGQREILVDDLVSFLRQEAAYGELGLPWHRGYLFHGPPGTGKTSIAKAVATHLKMDVYYIGLPSVKEDETLNQLLREVKPRSMLLLEDVDVAHATRERDDKVAGITLSGLLNALDGFSTPHGLITVMTTNDRAVLDPALTRPGRVDLEMELGYLDDDQLSRLAKAMLGREISLPSVKGREFTPAQIVGAIKSTLSTGEVEHALRELLT